MPYYTGTANDWAALLSALQSACTSNGWTLSGDVLHKGNCHVQVLVSEYSYVRAIIGGGWPTKDDTRSLYIRPGSGVDGSGQLVDGAMCMPRVGGMYSGRASMDFDCIPFTFPVEYDVHVNSDPDEVFLLVKHDVDYFQHLSFGHNPLAEATGGSGCWAAASLPPQIDAATTSNPNVGFRSGSSHVAVWPVGGGQAAVAAPAPPFFSAPYQNGQQAGAWAVQGMQQVGPAPAVSMCHSIHHGIDGAKWSGGLEYHANISVTSDPKLARGLNPVDGSAPLIRPIASILRPDNKISTVAQFEHFRLLRIDHMQVGEIYDLGPDRWKVYPFMRRSPDGSFPLGGGTTLLDHTGYLGWAVRYDGV